eukprot:gene7931-16243_t
MRPTLLFIATFILKLDISTSYIQICDSRGVTTLPKRAGRSIMTSRVSTIDYYTKLKRNDVAFSKIVSILGPGTGQNHGGRPALHAQHARRPMNDVHMWTHIFFVFAGIFAASHQFYDMLALLSISTPLSFVYHHQYEKPGLLASIEGFSAKCLFIYGLAQLLRAPTYETFLFESIFLIITAAVYIGTNLNMEEYDRWHSIMHIVPPLWKCRYRVRETGCVLLDMEWVRSIVYVGTCASGVQAWPLFSQEGGTSFTLAYPPPGNLSPLTTVSKTIPLPRRTPIKIATPHMNPPIIWCHQFLILPEIEKNPTTLAMIYSSQ